MNGTGPMGQPSYGYDAPARMPSASEGIAPSGKALVNEYRTDLSMTGFGSQQPRFNPLNSERTQSSALVDLNDPIQVHLLTETALSDSKEYEILSQEEVDGLKKQVASLTQRIEQARSNLAVQSKYLDAATNMTKLYSTKKKNLLGNGRNSLESSAREAETERQACERRCEDLASELFQLERRLMEPRRRLFEHTAGILQLTHRSAKSPDLGRSNSVMQNGIPGSPESLYTYNNLRYSVSDALPTEEDAFFDDRSLYLTLEQLDEKSGRPTTRSFNSTQAINTTAAAAGANAIEIPIKSPIREQTNQLREEAERLRNEAEQLRQERDRAQAMADSVQLEMDALRRESGEKLRAVTDTERRLEALNMQLREVIVSFDPARNGGYQQPPSGQLEPGDMIGSHVEYLTTGLATVQQEQYAQATQTSDGSKDAEMAASRAQAIVAQSEERLATVNRQLGSVLQMANPNQQPPPQTTGMDLDGQIAWLQGSIGVVQYELSQAVSASSASSADKQQVEQIESVLRNMWDTIQNGYADIQRRNEERRQARREAGVEADDDGDDDDAPFDASEQYSLQAFSAKVQWLYAQATNLREQKSVLKRQIKQQRELNNKSDAQKDAELEGKTAELQQARAQLVGSERQAQEAQEKLARALADLDELKKNEVTAMANVGASAREAEEKVKDRDAKMAKMQDELRAREAEVADTQARLKEAEAQADAAEARARDIEAQAESAKVAAGTAAAAAAAQIAQLQEQGGKATAVEEQLQQRDVQIKSMQAKSRELEDRLAQAEVEVGTVAAQLADAEASKTAAEESKTAAETRVAELEKEAKAKEEELEQSNMQIVELKMEATIAKAELEGAYGSRSERAKEVAKLSNKGESAELRSQVDKLKAELASTLSEFETLTKDTINAERERMDMEGKLDDALAAKDALEAEAARLRDKLDSEVGRLQEQLDAEKLKAAPAAGARAGAGASMLSEQFRATMKEERKKFQEEIRNEQAQRRKLEDELRALRRAAGPGKSPLSPR
ncbi:hypothetical protein RB595_005126 [Gaeumannomyces hyphopodioides]